MSAARKKVSLAQVLSTPATPEPAPTTTSPARPAPARAAAPDEEAQPEPAAGEGQARTAVRPHPGELETTPTPPTTDEAPAPRRRGRPRTRPVSEQTILVLWLPTTLHARLKATATSRSTRMLDVVLDALDALTDDELRDLVQASTPAPVKTGRFERVTKAATTDVPRTQVTIRGALPSQMQVIDELVTTTGAASRSALLVTVLDHVLPTRPRALR